jgi:DNA-binding PadR family transcriptional regulator
VPDPLRPLGRFAAVAFQILETLADAPRHAAAMTREIERQSGRRPGPAILYGAITRLEERNWIEPLPATDRRRPYRLTTTGEAAWREHLDAQFAAVPSPPPRLATT